MGERSNPTHRAVVRTQAAVVTECVQCARHYSKARVGVFISGMLLNIILTQAMSENIYIKHGHIGGTEQLIFLPLATLQIQLAFLCFHCVSKLQGK